MTEKVWVIATSTLKRSSFRLPPRTPAKPNRLKPNQLAITTSVKRSYENSCRWAVLAIKAKQAETPVEKNI